MAQGEPTVGHHPLHLVEFSKVRGIQALIAEDPVDGEVFHRGELTLGWGTWRVNEVRNWRRRCQAAPPPPPRSPVPASPGEPGGTEHGRWQMWCVCAAGSSLLPPPSTRTCTWWEGCSDQPRGPQTSLKLPPHPKALTPVNRSLPESEPSSPWPCSWRAVQGLQQGLGGGDMDMLGGSVGI